MASRSTQLNLRIVIWSAVVGALFLPILSGVTLLLRNTLYPPPSPDRQAQVAAADEAELMLNDARRAAQQSYRDVGEVPLVLAGEHPAGSCGVQAGALEGEYYLVVNGIQLLDDGRAQVVAVPVKGDYPVVRMHFYPGDTSGELVTERQPNR